MITVRDRYEPSQKAHDLFPLLRTPPQDNTYTKTAEQAYSWIAGLLAYGRSVREVKFDGTTARITVRELGRNTGSLFETTFSGRLSEMVPCLAAAYYWYDGRCVEPPPDYPFSKPEYRQKVLEEVAACLLRRNPVGDLLRQGGYEPLSLTGLYDIRGLAAMEVGVMLYAGITDAAKLEKAAGMRFSTLFETCEFVRVFGMTFEEALSQTSGQ